MKDGIGTAPALHLNLELPLEDLIQQLKEGGEVALAGAVWVDQYIDGHERQIHLVMLERKEAVAAVGSASEPPLNGEEALRQLIDLGVMSERTDGRIDVPDIYRSSRASAPMRLSVDRAPDIGADRRALTPSTPRTPSSVAIGKEEAELGVVGMGFSLGVWQGSWACRRRR